MEEKFSIYEKLKIELFERVLPAFVYEQIKKDNSFFDMLQENRVRFAHDMYRAFCESEKVDYPYQTEDFYVEEIKIGAVTALQINMPEVNMHINDIFRAYIVCAPVEENRISCKYFIIKRFRDTGDCFIIYIDEHGKEYLGEDLTEHITDKKYEQWRILCVFTKLTLDDLQIEKENEEMKIHNGWSRDWNKVDWDEIYNKVVTHKSKKGGPIDISKEIGLNKEDLMEYMAWILENDKKEEEKLLIGLTLCGLGVEVSDAEWAASNPEILKEIIDEMLKE